MPLRTRAKVGHVAEEVAVAQARGELHRHDVQHVTVAHVLQRLDAEAVEGLVVDCPPDVARRRRGLVDARDDALTLQPVQVCLPHRHRMRHRLGQLKRALSTVVGDDSHDTQRSTDEANGLQHHRCRLVAADGHLRRATAAPRGSERAPVCADGRNGVELPRQRQAVRLRARWPVDGERRVGGEQAVSVAPTEHVREAGQELACRHGRTLAHRGRYVTLRPRC